MPKDAQARRHTDARNTQTLECTDTRAHSHTNAQTILTVSASERAETQEFPAHRPARDRERTSANVSFLHRY